MEFFVAKRKTIGNGASARKPGNIVISEVIDGGESIRACDKHLRGSSC